MIMTSYYKLNKVKFPTWDCTWLTLFWLDSWTCLEIEPDCRWLELDSMYLELDSTCLELDSIWLELDSKIWPVLDSTWLELMLCLVFMDSTLDSDALKLELLATAAELLLPDIWAAAELLLCCCADCKAELSARANWVVEELGLIGRKAELGEPITTLDATIFDDAAVEDDDCCCMLDCCCILLLLDCCIDVDSCCCMLLDSCCMLIIFCSDDEL